MHSGSTIVDIIRERQKAMRREMNRRGIAMKAVAQDSGVDYYTLLTYFPADSAKVPVQIPGSVIFALTGNLPADILSLLLPAGHLIVMAPEEIDFDDISSACRDFIDRKERAHHPESEAGRDLGPVEKADLAGNVVRLRA